MKIFLLVLFFTLAIAREKGEPEFSDSEFYRLVVRRIDCDFVLAKIDFNCDRKYDDIDYKSVKKIKQLVTSCKQRIVDLDKKCRDSEKDEKCDKIFAKLGHECESNIFDLKRYEWQFYYDTDDYCDKLYDRYDNICEESKTGDISSIMGLSRPYLQKEESKIKVRPPTIALTLPKFPAKGLPDTKITFKIPDLPKDNAPMILPMPTLTKTKLKFTLKKPTITKTKVKVTLKKPTVTKTKVKVTLKKPTATKTKVKVTLKKPKAPKEKGKITIKLKGKQKRSYLESDEEKTENELVI